jgi:hypothetical protein
MPNVRVVGGVYIGVPIADYPFPPRPEQLRPLEDIPHGPPVVARLRSAQGLINGPETATFIYTGSETISAFAVEPGNLRFLLNEKEVAQSSWWNYDGSGYSVLLTKETLDASGIHLTSGQQVTLEVAPERFTDPESWQVWVTSQE